MKKLIFLIVLFLIAGIKLNAQPTVAIGLTDSCTITDKWGNDKTIRVMYSGITNIYLKRTSDSHQDWGSEIGSTGFYEFDTAGTDGYEGFYTLWVSGVERTEWGERQIATYLDVTGMEAMQDSLDMDGFRIINLGEPTASDHVVTLNYLNNDTSLVRTTGSDNLYGTYAFVNGTNPPACPTSPTSANHLCNKDYVDSSVASIPVAPYQASTNLVRVFTGATQQTGKVYGHVAYALNYFSSASVTNQGTVYIEGMGDSDSIISVNQSAFGNFKHIVGASKEIHLECGTSTASVTEEFTFQNLTLYFGANGGLGDRTYNSVTFNDCIIYAYDDITFTNCKIRNCIIFNESGEACTYDGSTEIINSSFNQFTIEGGSFSGFLSGMLDGFNTTYSMPNDPSSAP